MKKYFLICFLSFFSSFVSARWANESEAILRYDLWRSNLQVKKDGSYTKEVVFKVKILKESAIDSFINFLLTYNEQSQTVKILSAKTVTKGKTFVVDSKFIEDKPLASAPSGFDQIRQILIAFPRVEVGSDIYMHYKYDYKIAPYEDFFSYSQIFSNNWFKKIEIDIGSDLPLHYKLNDPQKFFKVYYNSHSGKYKLKLRSKRPLFKKIVDEEFAFFDNNIFPFIEIATNKKWSSMVKALVPEYENKISEPLPELYKNIVRSAKRYKTGSEKQINFIISSLIDKIRYMRDWRSINGGYIPRSLLEIVKTGFGDCKDMSISLSAILRQLGFKAQVALVYRDYSRHSSDDYSLPNQSAFNHAIVHAKINNKTFWLDPTNSSVYSRGIFPDIANRKTLILSQPNSEMLRTPKLHSSNSELKMIQNFNLTKNNFLKVTGDIHFKGRQAIAYTGALLNKSKKALDYNFINFTGIDISTLKEWTIGSYNLKSRIVKDFSINFSYLAKSNNSFSGYKSQLGSIFFFPYPYGINYFSVRTINRISDLFLGQKRKIVFISKLKNIKPVGNVNLNCKIKSKWFDSARLVESVEPLIIKDIYNFKETKVSIKDIKSNEFLNLQSKLKNCFMHFAMIYKKTKD
ncbi:MAG: DUF3857 domain-containing transglutaminase family protein [Bdellovibrionaceae bacterium]|nr:DUF3857 domain-containing transglutaminase family protein [Pseudobdellovibrionaceae bacterium]